MPTNFEVYRTSETENCVKLSNYSIGTTLTLPARSIVTIIAGGTALKAGVQENTAVNALESSVQEKIDLYPVPAQEVTYLSLDGKFTGDIHVTVIDPTGKIMAIHNLTKETKHSVFEIPTHMLKPGFYLLRIDIGDKSVTKRLLKN